MKLIELFYSLIVQTKMPKLLSKIRVKRKKVEATSSSSQTFSQPARKPLHVELYKDEIVCPPQLSNSNNRSRSERGQRPSTRSSPSYTSYAVKSNPAARKERSPKTKETEAIDKKKKREEKILAQKLAKERERTARAASALDNKGNALFERGYFDKAMLCYTKALKLKRRTFDSVLEEADDLVDKNSDSKKFSKSEAQALVSMATSINNIGYLRQRSGEATPEETMAAYKKSLRIKRRVLGNEDLSVGKTLNNIGSVYYLIQEFKGALSAYQEGIGIMRKNLGEHHPDIATVMSNIGDVFLASGDDENSLKNYRAALNIRYANFGRHDPRVVRLLEKIARIEIGDRMTPREDDADLSHLDYEENALLDLGMLPLPTEFQLLHGQVEQDMELLDKRAVDMVRDKVGILKGMRELSVDEEQGHTTVLGRSVDDLSPIKKSISGPPTTNNFSSEEKISSPRVQRTMAQDHVHYRLAKMRSVKDNEEKLVELDEQSTASNTSYYSGSQGAVDTMKSAIKLRQGIDSLRTLKLDDGDRVAPPKAVWATSY